MWWGDANAASAGFDPVLTIPNAYGRVNVLSCYYYHNQSQIMELHGHSSPWESYPHGELFFSENQTDQETSLHSFPT
jgi:hypothetical protein